MNTFSNIRSWGRDTFFGWWLVSSSIGIQILQAAFLIQAYGIYAPVWQDEFGWSKTTLATAFSLQRLESGLLGPLQGWLLKCFGPRLIVRLGLTVFGLGLLLLSRIDSLLGFYLIFLTLAAGASLGGFLSLMTVIVNWFERKRTRALALMQVGGSIGGLLIPLIALSVTSNGWRTTVFISGLVVLILGLPLSQLLRNRPEDYGQLPDGQAARSDPDSNTPPKETKSATEFSTRQALGTSAFWLLSIGHALAVMLVSAVAVHLVIYLGEALGFSLQLASLIIALLTASTLVGQLLGGFLGDRLNKRLIVMLAMLGHAGGILVLAFAQTHFPVIVFAILHGLAWGVRGPLMGALRADYFGRRSFATIMGFSTVIIMIGSMSGPIMAGYLADRSGSYRPAFIVLALLATIGSLVFAFAGRPRPIKTQS